MLRLRTFGGLALESDAGALGGAALQRRRLAVLAVLAAAFPAAVPRDRLLAVLWPDAESSRARQALSQALYALRRDTGADSLVLGGEELRLDPAAVETDVGAFRAALAAGDRDAAVALYTAPFLDGVYVDDGAEFERWAADERARLSRALERALEELAAEADARGDHRAAAGWWARLTELDPLGARAALGLVSALAAAGERAAALRHAERHARRVRDELGAEPHPDLAARVEEIRRAAPPPRHAAGRPPSAPGPLVGRERELGAAAALLGRADVRLLTVTGAGGSGKSRLALALAASFADEFDDVRFVDLSPIADPSLALPAIADAVGAHEHEGTAPADAVVAHVGARRVLLVLDNVERVVAAAADVARLLGACPNLTVLATSRVRLRVRGEHEFFVAPLPLPDPGVDTASLRANAAVALFVRRATEARADFGTDDDAIRAVAAACVRLDGLPLAIELAAARCRLLSARALLGRLDRRLDLLTGGARDLPSRHRTLRATLSWSDDLLGDAERDALRHLAVFAGGCALPALAAVLAWDETRALEAAQSLVDASLVRRADDDAGEPRLSLLETVREYLLERLRDAGDEDRARDRHLAHFLALAERHAADLAGDAQARALAALDEERDNLRAALDHAERAAPPDTHARLVLSLWRVWLVRGRWTEGRERIRRALERCDGPVAELLAADGALAQNQGDHADAREAFERALAAWRADGDGGGQARALASLGWLAWRRGELPEARRLSEQSLAAYRALGDARGEAQALGNVGWVAISAGDHRGAAATLAESLAMRRRSGDRRGVAFTLAARARALAYAGDLAAARAALDEALPLFREIGERQLHAFARMVAAEVALLDGDAGEAARVLDGEVVPVFREIGDRWGTATSLGLLGDALLRTGRADAARAAHDEGIALWRALGDRHGLALGLARAAAAAAARGDGAGEAALAAESAELLTASGGALPPID